MKQKWPAQRIEPMGGWKLDGEHLVSPSGATYKPTDLLGSADAAEIRGTTSQAIRAVFAKTSARIGKRALAIEAWRVIEYRAIGRPKKGEK